MRHMSLRSLCLCRIICGELASQLYCQLSGSNTIPVSTQSSTRVQSSATEFVVVSSQMVPGDSLPRIIFPAQSPPTLNRAELHNQ